MAKFLSRVLKLAAMYLLVLIVMAIDAILMGGIPFLWGLAVIVGCLLGINLCIGYWMLLDDWRRKHGDV